MPGLHPEDLDGDGVIRMTRVPDPVSGSHGQDPRILVKRSPSDFGGTYYHLYPKGSSRRVRRRPCPAGRGKMELGFQPELPIGLVPWRTASPAQANTL